MKFRRNKALCGRKGGKWKIIIIIKLLFLDYGCAKSQLSLSLPTVKKNDGRSVTCFVKNHVSAQDQRMFLLRQILKKKSI